MRDLRIFSLICVVLGGMGQGVIAPKLPELFDKSTKLAFDSGISATLMYLGIFLSTFTYGKLADEGKVHWLLSPGLIVYSLILVLLGVTHSTVGLFFLRFLEGLAISAVFVAADFILGRLSEKNVRGQWLSYYGVALSIGLLLGPMIALFFHSPLRPLLIVASVTFIFGLLAHNRKVPRIGNISRTKTKLKYAPLIVGSAYGYLEASLVAVFPVLALTDFQVTPEYCLVAVIISAALSSVFWGIFSDKFGSERTVITLLITLLFGSLLFFLEGNHIPKLYMAFLSCSLFGITAGGLYTAGFSWLLKTLPESQYGYASGAFARAYGIGSLMGPLLTGILAQQLASKGLFLSIAMSTAFCFLFILKLR